MDQCDALEHHDPAPLAVQQVIDGQPDRERVEQLEHVLALPLDLNWSQPGRLFDLRDRADRARAYEIVLREGDPEQITAVVDGVLLVDLWPELVLPRAVRRAWSGLIETTTGESRPG